MQEKSERLRCRPKDEQYLTNEELEALYHPECADCRESYKSYSRRSLFMDPKWRFGIRNPLRLISFYFSILSNRSSWGHPPKSRIAWVVKHFFKGLYRNYHGGYDGMFPTYTYFHIFEFSNRYYELSDFIEAGFELDGLVECDNLDEQDKHQIKFIRRYYRMFYNKINWEDRG